MASGGGKINVSSTHKNESLMTEEKRMRHNKNLRRFEGSGDVNMMERKEIYLCQAFTSFSQGSKHNSWRDERKLKCRGHKCSRQRM
jgi:hypothetical protein